MRWLASGSILFEEVSVRVCRIERAWFNSIVEKECLRAHLFNIYHTVGLIQQTTTWWYFLIFPRKQDLAFHGNCLHWRQILSFFFFFLGNKKNLSICRLLKFNPECKALMPTVFIINIDARCILISIELRIQTRCIGWLSRALSEQFSGYLFLVSHKCRCKFHVHYLFAWNVEPCFFFFRENNKK